jgi:hypothetical protein
MTDIYEGSSMNISAMHYGRSVASSEQQAMQLVAISAPTSRPGDILSRSPLANRGWVFQEALVSPVSLRFTIRGPEWECGAGLYDSTRNLVATGMIHPVRRQPLKKAWAGFSATRRRLDPLESAYNAHSYVNMRGVATQLACLWHDFVSTFSSNRLTMKRDKLPAVAGIAVRFAEELGWTYAAGLWKEHLPIGLTWHRGSTVPLVRQQDRAPSWTWASVDGPIKYHRVFSANNVRDSHCILYPELDFEILSLDIKETNPGNFGEIVSGRLEVQGSIHRVTITKRSMTGSLPLVQSYDSDIILDEEIDWNEPRQALAFRIVRHKEVAYMGGGCLNIFLILSPTGSHENEFRRVGVALCDYGEIKNDAREITASKVRDQAALDAAISSSERSRFTLV